MKSIAKKQSLLVSIVFCSCVGNIEAQLLFSDNFDLDTTSQYAVNKDPDSEVLFNYDYSAVGIPSAPNSSGGSTRGVRFRANIDTTAGAQAINISPIGGSFTGDYSLRFDLWINANGPFPAGGSGSTQFGTAGVGTTGAAVQKSSGASDGVWFAVDGEGQSGIDFRAYRGINLEGPTSTVYNAPDQGTINRRSADNTYYHSTFPGGQAPAAQKTAYPASANATQNQEGTTKPGAPGFAWRAVDISKVGNEVTWTIDGLLIAKMPNAVLAGNNIFVGHWDVFNSTTGIPEMNFSIVDNLRVQAVPETSTWALGIFAAAYALMYRRKVRG